MRNLLTFSIDCKEYFIGPKTGQNGPAKLWKGTSFLKVFGIIKVFLGLFIIV